MLDEGKLSQDNVAAIARRTDIISYAVLSEITHFQQEQVGEFKSMIQNFLEAQVQFYLKVLLLFSFRFYLLVLYLLIQMEINVSFSYHNL